ncbi:MAG: 4Fe-4S dicluster domain-containing protein [Acetobacteraceae bacterium]|nr:4Fe-4S dicluster domain-containing protein [Acetobacteraceae bacterium]
MDGLGERATALERRVMPEEGLDQLVRALARRGPVYGPVRQDGATVYGEVEGAQDLDLRCTPFTYSPKALLHRPRQVLFRAERAEGFVPREPEEDGRMSIIGVRPCDMSAIAALDQVFSQEYPDPYYQRRRQNALLAAVNCVEMAEHCFCTSMGTGPGLAAGFDLLLTRLEHGWLVEAGTEEGCAVLKEVESRTATDRDLQEKEELIRKAAAGAKKQLQTEGLPGLMRDRFEDPVWKERREECLGCANCTSVCPTCFCYDAYDVVNVKGDKVERTRCWTGCPVVDFARVHGGNFRSDRGERFKQFAYHKLCYWKDQFDRLGCVGCGRCMTWCPAKIDIAETAQSFRRGGEAR